MTLSSEPITLAVRSDRYWRIEVDSGVGEMGEGKPTLRIAWRAHQLIFVTRDEAPFTLAFGSTRIAHLSDSINTVVGDLQPQSLSGLVGSAYTFGEVHEGDRRHLLPPHAPTWWGQRLFWTGLVGSLLALAFVSTHL